MTFVKCGIHWIYASYIAYLYGLVLIHTVFKILTTFVGMLCENYSLWDVVLVLFSHMMCDFQTKQLGKIFFESKYNFT